MTKKKVLITGNSGYIGSHLTDILDNKFEVHGLDINWPVITPRGLYKFDITSDFNVFDEFDCVIHLAAKVSVGESVQKPWLYYNTNTIGTLNVLKKIKTKHFILASTGGAEAMNNPYAVSKKAAEDITKQYCTEHQIPFTIFRFYNVIGKTVCDPTNKDGLLWNLMQAEKTGIFELYGDDYNTPDGSAIRDYLHVNEVCYAIEKAIETPSNSIENLGRGLGVSVKEMIKLYQEVNNCDFITVVLPRREGDMEKSVLTNVSKYMTTIYKFKDYFKGI